MFIANEHANILNIFELDKELLRKMQTIFLLSFIFCPAIKSNQIKHLSHTRPDTVAIITFEFGGGKVRGGVCKHVITYKMVVPRQKDFAHDIALVAEILEGVFCSKVIKTMSLLPYQVYCDALTSNIFGNKQ